MIGGINIPKNGGLEMYMFNLAKQLQNNGHKLWIICQGDDDNDEIVEGVHITCLKTPSGFFAMYSFTWLTLTGLICCVYVSFL